MERREGNEEGYEGEGRRREGGHTLTQVATPVIRAHANGRSGIGAISVHALTRHITRRFY